jgi:hypothetical protein
MTDAINSFPASAQKVNAFRINQPTQEIWRRVRAAFLSAPILLSKTRYETHQHRNNVASDRAAEFRAFQARFRKFFGRAAKTARSRRQRLYPANPISGHADPA